MSVDAEVCTVDAQSLQAAEQPKDFWKRIPFILVHLSLLFLFYTGVSAVSLAFCAFLYVLRMFAITGGYHRYFSHRSYKTSRLFQFILGFLGATAAQRGPIWWASHHRHHHRHSDTPEDVHPPKIYGFWWAHVGWVLSTDYLKARIDLMRDFLKYPEIVLLDRFHLLAPISLGVGSFFFGKYLETSYPTLGTSGWQMLVCGFFLSTVLVYHGTFAVNSLTHMFGKRRFVTGDDSRNSLLIALFTLGEGWHNNHHRYPGSERQGFYWWEIDISHYFLVILSWFGIVWDLRVPPERIYQEALLKSPNNV
jgi:stearoyl-CoA desaturase (delta-9 desaturase)